MSAHTRKHPTKSNKGVILVRQAGVTYKIPKEVAERYRVANDEPATISAEEVFANINKNYTKPGALLRGIRVRENLTQVEMAEKLKVTQSDISQMEKGTRSIGRTIAKRIEKLFDVDYRSFLA